MGNGESFRFEMCKDWMEYAKDKLIFRTCFVSLF